MSGEQRLTCVCKGYSLGHSTTSDHFFEAAHSEMRGVYDFLLASYELFTARSLSI
jgi:hypothetical protein